MIAITGANGLLGHSLVKHFLAQGQSVRAIVRPGSDRSLLPTHPQLALSESDLLDLPSLLKSLEEVSLVIHAAGKVSFHPGSRKLLHAVNVDGTRNVVNASIKQQVDKLIHISSVAALGRTKASATVTEKQIWVNGGNNTDYAHSKYEAELEVYRGMEEGLQVSIVNPSVILAPVKSGQSSAQLISYASQSRWFYGNALINYVDVRDVCEIVSRLTIQNWNGERFIASAGATTMKDLLGHLATSLDARKPFVEVPHVVSQLAAKAEDLRAWLTGKEPLLSSQSLKTIRDRVTFDNAKVREKLQFQFRTLEDTVTWVATEWKRQAG